MAAPGKIHAGYAGIFLLAFGVRLLHVLALSNEPFFPLKLGDAASYDRWAREIASGDWLGTDVFYQAPLYPYFLAVVYRILDSSLVVVRIVQAAIGALAAVFVGAAAARCFSYKEGFVAGLLVSLYAPAVFFDALVQKSTLDLLLLALLLFVACRGRATSASALAAGAVLGALALSRENALLLVVPLAIWAWWKGRAPRILALALGLTLVLFPVGARNYLVGGELLLTTSQLGPNLYIGNNEDADGTYRALRPRRGDARFEREDATAIAEAELGRRLAPSEVSSFYVSKVARFLRDEPVAFLGLLFRKLLLTWNAVEIVDTEDLYSTAEFSPPLRLLGRVGSFGILLSFAVVGMALTWQDRRRLWLLYAVLGAYAASVVVFYVFARYRFPLVPVLAVFASAGIVRLPQLRRRPGPALLALAALLLSHLPLVERAPMQALTFYNWARGLEDVGATREAAGYYQRALELDPDFAMARNNLASLYLGEGRIEEARFELERAVELEPSLEDAWNNLGNLLLARGDAGGAERHFLRALDLRKDYPEAWNNLGNALSQLDRPDEASRAYERAIELRPEYANAHFNLGTLLFESRQSERARGHLEEALRLDPENAEAWNNLGITFAAAGDLETAARHFERALSLRPVYDEARRNLERARSR